MRKGEQLYIELMVLSARISAWPTLDDAAVRVEQADAQPRMSDLLEAALAILQESK